MRLLILSASDSLIRFVTPHLVIDFGTFACSLVWLILYWFMTFASYETSSSKSNI